MPLEQHLCDFGYMTKKIGFYGVKLRKPARKIRIFPMYVIRVFKITLPG